MKTKLYATLLACIWLGGACKKDEETVGPAACELASQRSEAVSRAATTYSSSPTKANCDAFKKAATEFLDAASRCNTVPQADITSARQSVNSLTCQ
ncbi:hypothetical protein [Spirosoma montaniterrae]|uniref:Lipoprotein n=1 Tax=Spirosoma montaniterrae TaxID=1178516 RepID=A0A1P9WY47_9BACT|nr:hypothetical protein [Spirosoma montaniterrae]AQG80301.1 hypothetical protein AWR27_13815 [Spirosoma montaniterrae]